MSNFANLKKQSSLGSLTEKLVKQVEKMNNANNSSDDRLWKPEMDKSGVGSATIRFLPSPPEEDLPWVKMYSHGFQGPGGWYIENSLTTISQKDPVTEYNRILWNTGNPKDQDTVRKQKRKLSYYSNIYVVKDPLHPENEGKVFLFKYGKKIFDKILNSMQPEFDDEEPINPFDFWSGANFRLKIRKVEGYWNYDKSEFDKQAPLLDDDDALEAIWKKEYSLSALIAADQFKTHEELEKRMNYVLGISQTSTPTQSRAIVEQESDFESFSQKPSREENVMGELEESYRKSKSNPLPENMKKELNNLSSSDEDEDDAMAYFSKLAND
jgi:hypothetical protein